MGEDEDDGYGVRRWGVDDVLTISVCDLVMKLGRFIITIVPSKTCHCKKVLVELLGRAFLPRVLYMGVDFFLGARRQHKI